MRRPTRRSTRPAFSGRVNLAVEAVEKPHFEISRICMQNLTPQNRVHTANYCAGMVNVPAYLRYTFFRVLFLQPR